MPRTREAVPLTHPPSPDAIQAGLPAESYVQLRAFLGASDQQLAEHLSIPRRTLQRRLAGNRFSSEESDRLTRLGRIFKEAAGTVGDVDSAREWMLTPNPSLDFKTPLELTATDTGCVEVERLLIRIEYGVF